MGVEAWAAASGIRGGSDATRRSIAVSRRDLLATGAAAALVPLALRADAREVGPLEDFTQGAPVAETGVSLTTPEVAEDGNTVRISVDAPDAVEIRIYAGENPVPGVAAIRFGPLAGSRSVSTRIRLARSQEVVAVARLSDGRFARAANHVTVIVGGCGA